MHYRGNYHPNTSQQFPKCGRGDFQGSIKSPLITTISVVSLSKVIPTLYSSLSKHIQISPNYKGDSCGLDLLMHHVQSLCKESHQVVLLGQNLEMFGTPCK